MLKHLSIKNYALIDELDIEFSKGFNTITGETGAGKSILLGGLALVLGKRADLGQIKDRSKKCVVEAIVLVSGYELRSLFEMHDLDYEEEVIIRRELLSSGKSRAFVNDTPVKLETLHSISSRLIDIHSQNQTSQLTDTMYLFSVIDAVSGNAQILKEYKLYWKQYNNIVREIQNLKTKQSEANRVKDYNSFLLSELNEITINSDQFSKLEERQSQLENTELIQQNLQLGTNILNDEQFGVLERLKELNRALDGISGFHSALQALKERVLSCILEIEDLAIEIERQEEQVSADPQELATITNSIEKVNQLLMKHQVQSFEELMELRKQLEVEYENTVNLEDRIDACQKEQTRLKGLLQKIAQKISETRRAAIPELKKALEQKLQQLGMPNARFRIDLEPLEQLNSNGCDLLSFKFTANKGAGFKDLKSSASGGELSRIMLCIKSILAEPSMLPTLIFDEIDTGISGEVADKMGDIMKQMSASFQLLTITHLPQIAAKGDVQFKVYKSDLEDQTLTRVKQLSDKDRLEEIAQMLGGEKLSQSALAHAKQLLN